MILALLTLAVCLLVAGAVDHTLTFRFGRLGENLAYPVTISSGFEGPFIDEAIPSNQTDLQLEFSLDVSQLNDFFLVSTVDMTIKTNSTSSPGQTITLKAGLPYVWYKNSGITNPLSVDITTLYVTNTTAGQLVLRCGYDGTP